MTQLDDLNAQLTQISSQIDAQTKALTVATTNLENLNSNIQANDNQIASANAAATNLYRQGAMSGTGVSDAAISYASQVSGFLSSSSYQGLVDSNASTMQQSYQQLNIIDSLNQKLQALYSNHYDVQQQINDLTSTTDGGL